MGRLFSHTSREELPAEQVSKALDAFRNPSSWPDWNSVAKNMLATKAESIDEGDHLAIFQMIKPLGLKPYLPFLSKFLRL